jgi:carbon storage regulator
MLVLSRRSGECVCIGEHVEVMVLEISGGRVKLGFSAPPDVAIQRNEIHGVYPRPLASWGQPSIVGEFCAP